MENPFKTRISKANWCTLGKNPEIGAASFRNDPGNKIYWFDTMLEGGLYVPTSPIAKDSGKPLTLLVTGPPGTGKSTLAQEMCYRLARDDNNGCHSLYISTESEAWKLRDKAGRFGWNKDKFRLVSSDDTADGSSQQDNCVYLWGVSDVNNTFTSENERSHCDSFKYLWNKLGRLSKTLIYLLPHLFSNELRVTAEKFTSMVEKYFDSSDLKSDKSTSNYSDFGIIAIDSLNIVPEEQNRSELFNEFLSRLSNSNETMGPNIVLFVLDSYTPGHEHKYWENVCDVVIRMDYHYEKTSEYFIRTIEIIKARYQAHVWGKQQLKIYSEVKEGESNKPLVHSHPYRKKEGGIFIYPSIHWFLSKYKREKNVLSHESVPTPLADLNMILGKDSSANEEGGLPRGRCTAMIGSRGAHKSHLGYYHILGLIERNTDGCRTRERGLIISLRDDESLAKCAMMDLLPSFAQKGGGQIRGKSLEDKIENYINSGDLEIMYFPPGYITPEEFYHRVLMSLLRLKVPENDNMAVNVTVMFNSLDQLSARFPLCSNQKIFIPGLIDTFTAEGATSIFIAVDEPGQPEHQYGLLTMADLIMSFHQREFIAEEYKAHLLNKLKADGELTALCKEADDYFNNNISGNINTVELKVVRFSGGQRAGDSGILQLVKEDKFELIYEKLFDKKSRLVFIPLS